MSLESLEFAAARRLAESDDIFAAAVSAWHDFQDLWLSVAEAGMLEQRYFDHFARLGLARTTIVLSQYVGWLEWRYVRERRWQWQVVARITPKNWWLTLIV
ncbi:hypothetical protein AAVH_13756 [Aphelenchoides avenae]|nr:hypothetical protein AAVH_13756 [Aphelenchus avenae]